jgi:hypothetical protein
MSARKKSPRRLTYAKRIEAARAELAQLTDLSERLQIGIDGRLQIYVDRAAALLADRLPALIADGVRHVLFEHHEALLQTLSDAINRLDERSRGFERDSPGVPGVPDVLGTPPTNGASS